MPCTIGCSRLQKRYIYFFFAVERTKLVLHGSFVTEMLFADKRPFDAHERSLSVYQGIEDAAGMSLVYSSL